MRLVLTFVRPRAGIWGIEQWLLTPWLPPLLALVREAEALASRLGLDSETVLRSVSHSSGGSYALGVVLQRGSAAETWQQIGYYMKKDLAILDRVAADLDVDLGMLRDVTREPASGA